MTVISVLSRTIQAICFCLSVSIFCSLQILSANEPSDPTKLPTAKRIVFLGDSITYAGGYINAIETALIASAPDQHFELLNLGLPSETVSGLSEPGHAGGQFPRPDLHERLARVLSQSKPQLVVACYGMNDGIYYPNSAERFGKFKSGVERLHKDVVEAGASIIHITPAFFDSLPIQSRLLPAGLDSYPQPYVGYDEVLENYATWLLSKRDNGWVVLDMHAAMKQAVLKKRETEPTFTFAADGVHPNSEGQAIIAKPLAEYWGLSLNEQGLPDHAQAVEIAALVATKQNLLKHAWLTATRHVRPGIEAGLPINEAETQAREIDLRARSLSSKR